MECSFTRSIPDSQIRSHRLFILDPKSGTLDGHSRPPNQEAWSGISDLYFVDLNIYSPFKRLGAWQPWLAIGISTASQDRELNWQGKDED